jgi:subtilase family serine protease
LMVTGPDLAETAITNPPATQKAGTNFAVTDTTKNQGTGSSGSSTTRYYLSADTAKDASDTLLTNTRGIATLAPGATSTGSLLVTIPTATPPGAYFLLACADDTGVVAESDETNNCRASVTTIQVTAP